MSLNDSNKTYGDDQSLVVDLLNTEGVQSALTVGTTAVLVNVSGTNLVSRKLVTLFNNSSSIIYWGYTNSVTVSTGTPIFKSQFIEWQAGDGINIYVIADSAGNNTRITEAL